jgi:hypothetical protein
LALAVVWPAAAQETVPDIGDEPLPAAVQADETVASPPALSPADEAASTALDGGPLAGLPEHDAVEEGLRVVTQKGYFDYDEEHNTIYSNERTRVTYKNATLEADHINLDVGLSEIQAAGNVVLTRDQAEIHAERLDYNFRDGTGSAYKASGDFQTLHVHYAETEKEVATFRRVSKDESVFTDATATACEFTVPHYYLRAHEVVIYGSDRVFMKGVTLYVRGVPVMYLPVYARSLRGGSPWFFHAGFKTKVGAYARLGYMWQHSTEEPNLADPLGATRTRSKGELSIFADYFSKRGPGAGLLYEYSLDYGRHTGRVDLYDLDDTHRQVVGQNSLQRWNANIQHRSVLTEDLTLTVNVDYFSDPDLYNDVLDLFQDTERRRVMERQARTALTLAREDYVARLLFEVKDRIGRNRINNFADPADNDRDFDPQPGVKQYNKSNYQGIDTDRWGRAAVRAPQVTVATRWLNLWGLQSVYYHSDLNIFNNLDKGLVTAPGSGSTVELPVIPNWNGITKLKPGEKVTVGTHDDAYVQGFDWYNSVLYRARLGDRTNLSMKFGVGGGMASRDQNTFGYDIPGVSLANPVTIYDINRNRGLTFIGPETFLVGTKPFNLKDVNPGFVYGDTQIRLDHRFTDALTGDITYNYRATTDNFLGDWYAKTGDRFVQDDLYNFRLRQDNLTAALRYTLAQPRLDLALISYRNLESTGVLFPGEQVSANGIMAAWRTLDETFGVSSAVGLSEFQLYAPSDPAARIASAWHYSIAATYKPRSGRWWTQLGTDYRQGLGTSGGSTNANKSTTDTNSELIYQALLGGRIGPKWTSQVSTEWDSQVSGLRELKVQFERDLHDAVLYLMIGQRNSALNGASSGGSSSSSTSSMDFRISISPKLPTGATAPGMTGSKLLQPELKTPAVSATNYY